MEDLELIETKVLIDELLNRFDHSAFIGMKAGIKGEESHEYEKAWLGNAHTIAGLLDDVKMRAFARFRETEVDR